MTARNYWRGFELALHSNAIDFERRFDAQIATEFAGPADIVIRSGLEGAMTAVKLNESPPTLTESDIWKVAMKYPKLDDYDFFVIERGYGREMFDKLSIGKYREDMLRRHGLLEPAQR